jgi:lipopolysaccharide export system permease protein
MKEESIRAAGGIESYQVETNRRTASAISVFIMIIIGAILGSKKVRGGMGLNIVTAIAMSSLYVVFLQFSSSFSVNGNLPPLLGANMPNIIFGVITLFLFRQVNK